MDETIAVESSDDNGNVPAEAPSQQPEVSQETPAEPAAAEPELFELPDGRKVSGAEVAQEYKNLLTDYTKKAQALSEIDRQKQPTNSEKPYQNPDWQPQTWQEAIELAKQEALAEIENKEKAQVEQRRALEDAIVSQVDELKTVDPSLNENALFLHATKYGFRDLKQAHQNMRDMADIAKKVQATTVQNIAKRADPVSIQPGATGSKDAGVFGTAVEYLRSLK